MYAPRFNVVLDIAGRGAGELDSIRGYLGRELGGPAPELIVKPSTPAGLLAGLRESAVRRGEGVLIHGALPAGRFTRRELRAVHRVLETLEDRYRFVACAPTFPRNVTFEEFKQPLIPELPMLSSMTWRGDLRILG